MVSKAHTSEYLSFCIKNKIHKICFLSLDQKYLELLLVHFSCFHNLKKIF